MEAAIRDRRSVKSLLVLLSITLCLGLSPRLYGAGDRPTAENAVLSVSLDPGDGTLSVTDKRTG